MGRLGSLLSGRGRGRRARRPWDRSRERWRAAAPDAGLTWGFEPDGDAFVERASVHGAFGPGRTVLEIGPGYGRLLRSALARGEEFDRWIGLDLSEANVEHLRSAFDDPRAEFRQGDAETAAVGAEADSLVSSLTFKHMYPTFEAMLTNVAGQMRAGAVAVFDLIEGEGSYFEEDGVTYIRRYQRDEVEEIARCCGFAAVSFDEVRHHPELVRMLAVARRP